MSGSAQRLDAFTDAAFAFALTLFVVGGGGARIELSALRETVEILPAFAIGFAIIAMFWYAHVRWREMRGSGGTLSVLLTLTLVFAVLGFVQPLRAMAVSFADFLLQRGGGTRELLGEIFRVYGAGFAAMSAITLGLYLDALRNKTLDEAERHDALAEAIRWVILTATGLTSLLFASLPGFEVVAPPIYATLPLTIGGFSWWWSRRRERVPATATSAPPPTNAQRRAKPVKPRARPKPAPPA